MNRSPSVLNLSFVAAFKTGVTEGTLPVPHCPGTHFCPRYTLRSRVIGSYVKSV